jgi:hypothetical protein
MVKEQGGSGNLVQDNGLRQVFRQIIKLESANVMEAFNGFLLGYL